MLGFHVCLPVQDHVPWRGPAATIPRASRDKCAGRHTTTSRFGEETASESAIRQTHCGSQSCCTRQKGWQTCCGCCTSRTRCPRQNCRQKDDCGCRESPGQGGKTDRQSRPETCFDLCQGTSCRSETCQGAVQPPIYRLQSLHDSASQSRRSSCSRSCCVRTRHPTAQPASVFPPRPIDGSVDGAVGCFHCGKSQLPADHAHQHDCASFTHGRQEGCQAGEQLED